MGHRLRFWAILIGAIAILSRAARAEGNAWQELSPDIRDLITRQMRPVPYDPFTSQQAQAYRDGDHESGGDAKPFKSWYIRYYCPTMSLSATTVPQNCPDPKSVYDEFEYDSMTLEQRVSLACVLDKIKLEFPNFPNNPPGLGAVSWVGGTATINFIETGSDEQITSALKQYGYSDSNGAAIGHLWGLRDYRTGAQLHWKREYGSNVVNVHIDLNNPGQSFGMLDQDAPKHVIDDLWDRDEYTPGQVLAAVPNGCGVGISDLLQSMLSQPAEIVETLEALVHKRKCSGMEK